MPEPTTLHSDLFASPDLLETLLEVSLVGIAILRPLYAADDDGSKLTDLAYVQLNPVAQRLLHLPAQPAETFLTLHPDAEAAGLFNFYQSLFETGKAGSYTVSHQHNGHNQRLHLAAKRSGQVVVVSVTEAPDAAGSAETAAPSQVENEALLPVFNALPEAYLLLAPDLRIVAASDAYLAATLTTREKLLGRNLFEAFPDNPETPEAKGTHNLRQSLEQARTTGQPHEMALQHYDVPDPDQPGQFVERYWLPRNTPVLDAAGRLCYFIHSVINVTESVRAGAELRESQDREQAVRIGADQQREQLYHLFMQAPAMICVLEGPAHVFKLVNPPYQQLVGSRPLLGKPIAEAMPELAGQPIFELLDGVYRTGQRYEAHEMLVQLDHGNSGRLGENYYNFTYQPIRNLNGEINGILVFAYEVTTQVLARQGVERSEAQLRQLNQQLEAANQALLTTAHTAEAAQTEAETQRQRLYDILEQLPASIATYHGPDHVYQLVNPRYQQLFPGRTLQGRAIREVLPELQGQQYFELFDQVYQTGEPFYGDEMETWVDPTDTGQLERHYFNVFLQALRDGQGQVNGILNFAYDATEQVQVRQQVEKSRRQVEQLNQELATANEELLAASEEVRANFAELQLTEQALLELNNDLENHVEARTLDVQQAQQEVERQRARLERFFMQAPAAICVLDGPDLVYELVNPNYQQLFPGRELQGKAIVEAMPEIVGHTVLHTLQQVYQTGETHQEPAMLIAFQRSEDGVLEDRYFNYIQQARYNEYGQIDGVLVFAFEVTTQVLARQQADALQAEVLASAQRLAQERETFYQVFEQTPASIALLRGPEHRVEYHNQAYQQLFPGRNMRGLTIAEMQPEAVEQGFVALLDGVYQTGETFYGNALLLSIEQPEGPPKDTYFNFTYQAYRQDGQIVGISVFAFDVTEQVLARQQREAMQQQLQRIFAQAPVAICVFQGPDYVLEVVNPPMSEMLGRTSAQLLSRPFFEAIPEIATQGLRDLLDQVRLTGIPFEAQERPVQLARHQPGETGYFNFVYQPLRDELDQMRGIICVALDVTEQVLARRRVEQNERQLQLITDALPVLIAYLNRDEKYQFVNRSYETWFNQALDQLLGQTAHHVLGEKAYRNVQPYIARTLAGERMDFETRLLYPDNVVRDVRVSYVPDFEQEEVVGFYAMVADVSDQVLSRRQVEELNEELAAINEELQATNEELSDTNQQLTRTNVDLDNFIYTASHDLRAPIANIEGLLTALTQQLPEASAADAQVLPILEMMQGAVERFQKTIDHLTDVTKLQKEQVQPAQTVDLAAIIEEVRLDLAPLLESTQAQLEVDVNDCPTISFSQKNLRSVVYNLLSNALKYRAPDRVPHVRLRCRQTESFAALEVQDNGLGLDAAQQVRLFGMFQRLHDHVEGTGIGLYMVKRMVENAGGHIHVESEPGIGSTFTVSFPH